MKSLILALALVSAPAFAHNHEGHEAGGSFESNKAMALTNTDKRIESLTKMKTCIQGATAQDAMKACKEAHRTEMAALKDDMLDQRIQKLQEKKAKKTH